MLKIGPVCAVKNQRAFSPSFKEAKVNIVAMSDSHGRIEALPDLYEALDTNKEQLFTMPDKTDSKKPKNHLNLFVNAGDWFINPGKKGFISDPLKSTADFQVDFLNGLLHEMKNAVPDLQAYYTLGNHCLDDGDDFILKKLAKADVTTLLTNVNLKNSKSITDLDKDSQIKFQEHKILEVPDDKNPNLKHKVLLLGLTTPSVDFYVPNMVKGLDIVDRNGKKDIQLKTDDFKNTYKKLNKIIGEFKKENPNGGVVMLSHNGNPVADMIVQNVPDIDVIVNGHDHKNTSHAIVNPDKGNSTFITSAYQNNEKFTSIKLHFADNGKLDNINTSNFYTNPFYNNGKAFDKSTNPMYKLLNKLLGADLKPSLYVSGPDNINKLSTTNIRNSNNYLANFTTDSVLSELNEHDKTVEIMGLFSASIRQSLPVNGWTSNIKLLNLFCGRSQNLSTICKGDLTGSDITKIIIENYGDNLKNNNRNPLIHYSNIKVEKGKIDDLIIAGSAQSIKDFSKFIMVKDKTEGYKPIDMTKTYTIALPKELFVIPNVKTIVELKDKFQETKYNADDLFKDFVERNDYKVSMKNSSDMRILA